MLALKSIADQMEAGVHGAAGSSHRVVNKHVWGHGRAGRREGDSQTDSWEKYASF